MPRTLLVGKIDKQYLPKLSAIEQDIRTARNKTAELLRAENREDQKRVLESNRESQKLAEDAAKATGAISCSSASRSPRRASAPRTI
jgi:hypothetical protein